MTVSDNFHDHGSGYGRVRSYPGIANPCGGRAVNDRAHRSQCRGTPLSGVPGSVVTCVPDVSGECGLAFAAGDNEFVTDASGKHVVCFL